MSEVRADRPLQWTRLPEQVEAVMVTADPEGSDNRRRVAAWCGGEVTGMGDVRVPTGDGWNLLAGPGEFVIKTSADPDLFTVVGGAQWRAHRMPLVEGPAQEELG